MNTYRIQYEVHTYTWSNAHAKTFEILVKGRSMQIASDIGYTKVSDMYPFAVGIGQIGNAQVV